jgi:hypothetical protein
MNTATLDREQKERLRHIIRDLLAIRHPVALSAMQIRNKAAMETDFPVSTEDCAAAAEFLTGLGQLKNAHDNLGSTPYWQATPAGVLASERETAAR